MYLPEGNPSEQSRSTADSETCTQSGQEQEKVRLLDQGFWAVSMLSKVKGSCVEKLGVLRRD